MPLWSAAQVCLFDLRSRVVESAVAPHLARFAERATHRSSIVQDAGFYKSAKRKSGYNARRNSIFR
jgi:hypothetical protein